MDPSHAAISFRHLTKYYGTTRGIEDVCLEISAGEVLAFLGPNGAGKSTSIRVMLGLMRPTSGSVALLGDEGGATRDVRRRLGYLPEAVSFYRDIKVAELLSFVEGFYYRQGAGPPRARELAERFELDQVKRIRECSKGTLQKIGIIQAFLHAPDLLVLDEPTAGLDPLMQREFYKLVSEERSRGATVFLSSHNLTEVEAICTRVAMIKAGRLIAVQSIEDLKRNRPKKVEVELGDPGDADLGLPGEVLNLRREGSKLSFLYGGGLRDLTQWLNARQLVDFSCYDPPLQELFLAYYDQENQVERGPA